VIYVALTTLSGNIGPAMLATPFGLSSTDRCGL